MKKQIISLLLVMCIVCTVLPATVYAAEIVASGTCGDQLTWTLDAVGTLTISGTGAMDDFGTADIPWRNYQSTISQIKIGNGVTSIGKYAFYSCNYIISVVIPNNVKSIGSYAFYSCDGLTKITIGNNVVQIGESAFAYCESLASVNLSKNLTTLDDEAFAHCSSLREISIPSTLSQMGSKVFWDCTSLVDVTIESGVSIIGPYTFANCKNLKSIAIPSSVSKIGNYAFSDCANLQDLTFAEGVSAIGEYSFSNCDNLNWVVIPRSLHAIPKSAFSSCSQLKYVSIPVGVDSIAKWAFSYCEHLTDVFYEGNIPDWNNIAIATENNDLLNADIHYNTYPWPVLRLSGSSRSETAFKAAEELKEVLGVNKFDTIILASGDNFADALAGSYLAAVKSAPILLYRKNAIAENATYIRENLAYHGTVYILGGTASVSQEMEDALSGLTVKRLYGSSRFDTNLAILREAGISGDEILVATGWNFADCLSASATGKPILLVNSSTNKLTNSQIKYLRSLTGVKFTIIGGSASVSIKLATELAAYGMVDRVYGATREETSVKVAERYFGFSYYALVAYSRNFPDGLCGGPLAYALNSPLLLTNVKQEAPAAAYVADNGIPMGIILGGTASIADATVRTIFAMDAEDIITVK